MKKRFAIYKSGPNEWEATGLDFDFWMCSDKNPFLDEFFYFLALHLRDLKEERKASSFFISYWDNIIKQNPPKNSAYELRIEMPDTKGKSLEEIIKLLIESNKEFDYFEEVKEISV